MGNSVLLTIFKNAYFDICSSIEYHLVFMKPFKTHSLTIKNVYKEYKRTVFKYRESSGFLNRAPRFKTNSWNTLTFLGGPLDLMSRRIVAAGTVEMAHYIAQEIQTITYERDDHNAN